MSSRKLALLSPADNSLQSWDRYESAVVNNEKVYSLILRTIAANELRCGIMVLATHPHVQKRAQQELQNILGDDLPSLDDIDRLPYVRAMVKEILRWRVVAPK